MEFRYMNQEVERDRNAVIETLREREHHYKSILESLPAPVYTCDRSGFITFYNKAAVELWGRTPVPGKDMWTGASKIYNLDGERMMPDACPMAVCVNEGKIINGQEILVERADGAKRRVLTHPEPFFDGEGNVTGAMNMLIDVTEQRETQRILERTEEKRSILKQSNHSLETINNELEQFAYVASHDLQEPVRKIQFFSEQIRNKNKEVLDSESLTQLDKVIRAAQRMRSLIDDILHFSRSCNHSAQFVKTDLNTIYKAVLEDLELKLQQKGVRMVSHTLPEAEVVPIQISQMLYNLLENAVKYSIPGQLPVFYLEAKNLSVQEWPQLKLNPSLKYFMLTLKDNGIGFNTEDAEHIFGKFKRGKEMQSIEGSGLGLAICRKIARSHQGEIFAESVPGIGTQVHVVLPFHQN